MESEDRSYFERRVAEERARAFNSTDPASAHSHFEMAQEYQRRLEGEVRCTVLGDK